MNTVHILQSGETVPEQCYTVHSSTVQSGVQSGPPMQYKVFQGSVSRPSESDSTGTAGSSLRL